MKTYAAVVAPLVRATPTGPRINNKAQLVALPVIANDGTQTGTELQFGDRGITTSGTLSQFERAWVYVGVRPSDGCVKIGMSGDVPARCKTLCVREFFSIPVMPAVARLLETMTLRRLGVPKRGGEWVQCRPEAARQAAIEARDELSLVCHADPSIPPAEAAAQRRARNQHRG